MLPVEGKAGVFVVFVFLSSVSFGVLRVDRDVWTYRVPPLPGVGIQVLLRYVFRWYV